MELVIDANILFSALIKDSHTRHFLLLSNHRFYTSEFVFTEIRKHIKYISKKTSLPETEIRLILEEIIILSNIKIISLNDFKEHIEKAKLICPNVDDIQYFALALKLRCPIWSNDKKLQEQDIIKIYTTEQVFQLR